jgi:hypothetical protein
MHACRCICFDGLKSFSFQIKFKSSKLSKSPKTTPFFPLLSPTWSHLSLSPFSFLFLSLQPKTLPRPNSTGPKFLSVGPPLLFSLSHSPTDGTHPSGPSPTSGRPQSSASGHGRTSPPPSRRRSLSCTPSSPPPSRSD